ncbi:MAG: hypothetical protein FJ303_25075 [Planctomycetes bacterium]|nr:hypothetical protein [Planctomycetota bacterium]
MKRLIIAGVFLFCAIHATHAVASDNNTGKKAEPSIGSMIPWSELSQRAVVLAKPLVANPTVHAKGPVDTFMCTPVQYCWLLDNPDRAVTAWRRLGAKCVSIQRKGPAAFGYTDDNGSNITWEVVHHAPGVRIWHADGKVKPNAVLPLVPVKALIVLRYTEGKSPSGAALVQHHAEVMVHTDSKAAVAVTKLMGQSAPKLAEQGLGQLQLFFSALSCYVDRHPERVDTLFRPEP